MTTLQLYASELSKFYWADEEQTVLVAGEGVTGIVNPEDLRGVDPIALVGRGRPEPEAIEAGTKWAFRSENPIVQKDNGGQFAFLVSTK